MAHDDVKDIIDNLGADAHRFSGKTVLLSGGGGFLGRHFIAVFRRLNKDVLAKPCSVISADNYITGDQLALHEDGRLDPNIVDVWADVSYPLPVREDLHFIMHAAGVASPVFYMKYPLETIESAVQGTKNLMELARKNKDLEGFPVFLSRARSTAIRIRNRCRPPRPIMATCRASARAPATTSRSAWARRSRPSTSSNSRCR